MCMRHLQKKRQGSTGGESRAQLISSFKQRTVTSALGLQHAQTSATMRSEETGGGAAPLGGQAQAPQQQQQQPDKQPGQQHQLPEAMRYLLLRCLVMSMDGLSWRVWQVGLPLLGKHAWLTSAKCGSCCMVALCTLCCGWWYTVNAAERHVVTTFPPCRRWWVA